MKASKVISIAELLHGHRLHSLLHNVSRAFMSSSCTSLAATVIKPTSKCFASEFASLVESTELPYKPARASMVRSSTRKGKRGLIKDSWSCRIHGQCPLPSNPSKLTVFGFPTRFGMTAAQFKAFMDATGGLWKTQQLVGKPAGIFYRTSSQGGGHETTALTAITQLVHHGMVFVPIGYTFGAGMFEMEEVKGGSPYGSGTYVGGDGIIMWSCCHAWKCDRYLVFRNAFFLCQFWPIISHRAALCIAKVFTRSKSHLLHQLTSFGRGLFFFFSAGCVMICSSFHEPSPLSRVQSLLHTIMVTRSSGTIFYSSAFPACDVKWQLGQFSRVKVSHPGGLSVLALPSPMQVGYYSSWCSKANAVGGKKLQSLRHDQVGIKVKKPNPQGKIKANMDMKQGMRIRVMMEDLGF
ncbi:hypothetical protein KIW84_015851 [Lathyrus oleraceus]|uniref:NAD(P)H dehydrogenase (quinone) n=1 Tax=Pisum sativum TaxID=3888 RepID=A0A9D5BRP3_PEA|nr:hypothetical protein KIW84_015851 [Pisum sativum]